MKLSLFSDWNFYELGLYFTKKHTYRNVPFIMYFHVILDLFLTHFCAIWDPFLFLTSVLATGLIQHYPCTFMWRYVRLLFHEIIFKSAALAIIMQRLQRREWAKSEMKHWPFHLSKCYAIQDLSEPPHSSGTVLPSPHRSTRHRSSRGDPDDRRAT